MSALDKVKCTFLCVICTQDSEMLGFFHPFSLSHLHTIEYTFLWQLNLSKHLFQSYYKSDRCMIKKTIPRNHSSKKAGESNKKKILRNV
jgi:hypothetical protein